MKEIQKLNKKDNSRKEFMLLEKRYGIFFDQKAKDETSWLLSAAKRHTSGDTIRMAQRLLDDFRKNLLGNISLEVP